MHHHNCFVISALSRTLDEQLREQALVKCFSNSIDEIYFEFSHFAFRCIFYKGELFFSFDNAIVGENRLFKPQFKELIGSQIVEVKTHPYERSFHIKFDNDLKLVFKCFGRKSNILLYDKTNVNDTFRKNIETDNELGWEELFRNNAPEFNPENFDSEKIFSSRYPSLPSEFYQAMNGHISTEYFETLLEKFLGCQSFAISENTLEIIPDFSAVENNVLSAVTDFTGLYLKNKVFSEQKNELVIKFSTLLKEKENYLKSNTDAMEKLLNSRKDEEIGNIILANLHLIPEGQKKAIVNDVYHNRPIEIKLDEKLTAIKNADVYFKKDKAKPFIIRQLKEKISKGEIEIKRLTMNLTDTEKATSSKDLKSFIKNKSTGKGVENLPYKFFTIDDYEVLVGKHAESNEKLLNYFSDKDDLWLHAKDVGGSHVIIKMKKNKPLPDTVLEKAAGLAAYFSKSRKQSLATVIYTPRKYVRKIKGADKGKVTVMNEKSILVKPEVP